MPLVIIAILIVLNGIFVAAEFAIVGVPRTAIDRRAARGNRVARIVQGILGDPRRQDRYIATAQLGITLASLGLGMYGEHVLAGWIAGVLESWGPPRWIAAHTIAAVVAVTVLTYFHIVVGEMVPKSFALQHAEATVLWITPVIRAIQLALYPLVMALNGIGNGLLRVVGVRRHAGGAEHVRTPAELAYIVRESQSGGLLRRGAAEVVQELLDFSSLTARDVMVPRVRIVGLPIGSDREQVRRVMRRAPHTRYPVYDGTLDRIMGMLHVKDIIRDVARGESVTAERLHPVPFVPETSSMDHVLGAMRSVRAQMVVVMDEHGGTAGIVTLEDLFEEVVGEFSEDPDAAVEIRLDQRGQLHVAGTARLEDVGQALARSLDHQDVDTVSGLVLSLLGRPAAVGDVVMHGGVRFEVVRLEGRGVAECIASREW